MRAVKDILGCSMRLGEEAVSYSTVVHIYSSLKYGEKVQAEACKIDFSKYMERKIQKKNLYRNRKEYRVEISCAG